MPITVPITDTSLYLSELVDNDGFEALCPPPPPAQAPEHHLAQNGDLTHVGLSIT